MGAPSLAHMDIVTLLGRLSRRDSVARIATGLKIACLIGIGAATVALLQELVAGSLADDQKLSEIEQAALDASTRATTTGQRPASSLPDFSPIATRNIFGPFTIRQSPAAATPLQKPVPVIPLDLIGTFIEDGAAPYAIIEDRNKKNQEIFMLNEMIFGSAKLVSIKSDSVEIERNGQRETLRIDLVSKRGGDSGTGASGESEFVVSEADIDQALANLPLLLTQARAVPYFKDGQAIGLRMFAIRSGSLFEKIGIRNGDILKSINGSSLGDLSQAMKLFERLKSERNLSLTLERDRQEREFKYSIR